MMIYLFVGILLGTLPAMTRTTCVESITPEVIDEVGSCLSNIAACQAKNQVNQETTEAVFSTEYQQQSTVTLANIQSTNGKATDVTTAATTNITKKEIVDAKTPMVVVTTDSSDKSTFAMSSSTSAVCKAEWEFFQNRCYFESTKKVNWSLAEADCVKHGGHLASIHSMEENNFIKDLIEYKAWIGANDIDQEKNFTWTDGSNFSFSDWQGSNPDNYQNNENCVVLQRTQYWNDISCTNTFNYICKIDQQ